jgi:hypothetical protein
VGAFSMPNIPQSACDFKITFQKKDACFACFIEMVRKTEGNAYRYRNALIGILLYLRLYCNWIGKVKK